MTVAADPSQALFKTEYELELEAWLRRRFRSVCIWYMVLLVCVYVTRMLLIIFGREDVSVPALIIHTISLVLGAGTIAHYLWGRRWHDATREQMLRGASSMILILGVISFIKGVVMTKAATPEDSDFILPLFFWHLIACLFLPWTPRESLRPILPLLAAWAIGVLILDQTSWTERISKVVFSPAILLPGLGICAIRLKSHSHSFRSRMVGKHFLSLRRELAEARGIHESMFPRPHDDGHVKFEYTYAPMRELGGDFIHLHVGRLGHIHLTLLDVTGHGLAAALTVNRLYGELERIRGESELAEPGEVLTLLNRYINHTMTRHNIYVTGLCLMLDPFHQRLIWASAGHPPAFLRGANGAVTMLEATSILLGAVTGREYHTDQKSIDLTPGDVVIVYTDGTFEARDRIGKQLGLKRLTELMRTNPPPRHWPDFIAAAVQKHHAGRSDDDILIASLAFMAARPQAAAPKRAMVAS